MTTNEYVQFVLEVKKETSAQQAVDEAAACEAARLVSGGFTFPLFEALWMNDFDVNSITQHLESLYDSENYFGLVYFTFILANAAKFTVPAKFTEMSATDVLVPYLSAEIIEDWLEYYNTYEATEAK
jgi:hypothetical protein